MSTYLNPPPLPHLGIYFDAKGYAITRFSCSEGYYQIDRMTVSKKCTLDGFIVDCEGMKPIKSAYVNSSKLAVYGLSQSGLSPVITSIPDDYDKDAPINLRDTHEILSALLTDRKIEIDSLYSKSLISELSRYEIGDISHSVLSLFYGIGVHNLHTQRETRVKRAYTTGHSYQGYSISHYG